MQETLPAGCLNLSLVQIMLQGAVTWDVVPCTDHSILNCSDGNSARFWYVLIVEWVWLEGAFKGCLAQPSPAVNKKILN